MRKKHIVGVIDQASIRTTVRTDKNKVTIGSDNYETASIAYTGELLPAGTASYGSELWSNQTPNFRVYRTATENVQYVSTESMTIGKTYLVTLNITNSVGTIPLYPSTGGVTVPNIFIPVGTVGTYSVILTAIATGVLRWIGANTGSDMTISTISVKEVLINPNLRYLKNSGKDKTPALVESGQGKFFNGTSQYLNTGIIPNQAEGTLVTRFTYSGSSARSILGFKNASDNGLWIGTTSGYIGLSFGSLAYTVNYVNLLLTVGKSYHIAVKWLGSTFNIYIDGVLLLSGTGTPPSLMLPIYVGARNNNGTADIYYNNVIDETYYYDVALTDAQIQSLYKYPEKVKAYNGAIVPDIGSEANCKLFLPMCENSGSNVVNVAVAKGSEGFSDPTCSDSSKWLKGGTTTVENGRLNWFGGTYVSIREQNIPLITGKYYSITWDVVSYTSGQIRPTLVGGTQVSGSVVTAIGTYTQILQATTGNTDVGFQSTNVEFIGSIDNVSVKEITAYPLASYATTMHTSAAKLSYGAQCTAWKRDSLGVLLGMSNGLSFDGGVSVKGVSTGWTPVNTEPFVIESVVKVNNGVLNQMFGTGYLVGSTTGLGFTSAGYPQGVIADKYVNNSIVQSVAHIVIIWNGTVGQSKIYINGIEISYVKETSFVNPTTPFYIGSLGVTQKNIIAGTPKIHKGTQYAKFNIAKAWANAQKTIAKLGA